MLTLTFETKQKKTF